MESVLMASPGSSTRLKSRLRNAAANFLTRNSKARSSNRNHAINHKNNRNCTRTQSLRSTASNFKHVNNFNQNNNGNHDHSCINNNEKAPTTKNINNLYKGTFTREVYNAICVRLGQTPHIPEDSVQALFNDMHLYPSKTQVSEMLQCARQCGRRNGTSTYLTFGEFCIFAREMKNPKPHKKPSSKTKKCVNKCEVFLGGSCNPTTWRTDTAIPELQKHGITYYNPQVSMWAPELVAEEHDAKQSASVLLYVLDSQTRSVGGMIEVAYLIAAGRCVIVVADPYRVGQTIMGETLSNREYVDLVNGQTSLLALVKSHGITVHNNLTSALQCTTNLLRNSSALNGITAEEQITYKLQKLRDIFDYFDSNNTGELHLNEVLDAYNMLTNRSLEFLALYKYLSASSNSDPSQMRISFEQFCALVAEFSTNGCENFTTDDWASQPLQRQCSQNNNSHCVEVNKHRTCVISENEYNYSNGNSYLVDVYLGGSYRNQNNWREQVIPLLKKNGLTYYNPAIRETDCYEYDYNINNSAINSTFYFNDNDTDIGSVCESNVLHWKRAMDISKVLLFVITNDTRSLSSMILAAYYIGLNRDVVLCVEHLPVENSEVGNEKLSKQAIKDYNRGRVYLSDVAKRKQLPVFENITEAVQCTIEKCQSR